MMSLTQQLHTQHCNAPHKHDDSILFFAQQEHNNLTYKQSFEIINEHECWLQRTINDQLNKASCDDHTKSLNSNNDIKINDVIIAYLSDNSPDLLLSVLACIHLTTTKDTKAQLLPAMLNGRWTPREMERALKPSLAMINNNKKDTNGIYMTIVLYGVGYENVANDAVRLMNAKNDGQFAVSLSLPQLSQRYCNNNIQSNTDIYLQSIHSKPKPRPKNSQTSPNNNLSNENAILLFTSGTSSPNGAKGVLLSHTSLYIQSYAKTQYPCYYNVQTNMVATTVPWYHVGGLSSALAVVLAGGTLIFPPTMERRRRSLSNIGEEKSGGGRMGFQPESVLKSISPPTTKEEDITSNTSCIKEANTLVVVPAMLHSIIEYATTITTTYPNVKLILIGGQSIGNGRLYKQTRQLFPNARFVQTYACTEACSSITFEDLGWKKKQQEEDDDEASLEENNRSYDNTLDGATCVGLPPPHIQIGIFDAAQIAAANSSTKLSSQSSSMMTLRPLTNGKVGIIGTLGPHTMSGYWNRGGTEYYANATNKNDNWMLTNDLGYIHPTNFKLYFCGRVNDVIRTGGESVLSTEVERIISSHDNIVECAVFALPDEKYGEAVCAAIVIVEPSKSSDNNSLDAGHVEEDEQWKQRIHKYCSEKQLAGYKRPRRVFRMKTLPRNSSGKVLKHAIIRLCASTSKESSRL